MVEIEGVILVISCNKYLTSRVINNPYRLTGDTIADWKIIYVIGDETLAKDYSMEYHKKIGSNLLKIKCSDDYIYLFKKIALAKRVVNKLYNIKKGIIKCDDDILFNKKILCKYLSSSLNIDYSAKRPDNKLCKHTGPEYCNKTIRDNSIPMYFHRNPQVYNSLTEKIKKKLNISRGYINFPKITDGYGGRGGVYFLSTKASKIIVEYFKKCNCDLFHRENNGAYPFIAEDIGTGFILCKNKIPFTPNNNLYSHIAWWANKNLDIAMAFHTHVQGKPLGPLPAKIIKILSDNSTFQKI